MPQCDVLDGGGRVAEYARQNGVSAFTVRTHLKAIFAKTGVRRQADGSVMVDGEVAIRDLNRAMEWDLPDDQAVTIAGLVIHEAQAIPEPGQTFIFHHHRFQILRRQRNQITAMRVSPPLKQEEEEN